MWPATTGTGDAASIGYPVKLAASPDGTLLFVVDGSRIRQIVIATREVTTLAGSGEDGYADGTGADARFNDMGGVAFSPDGTLLFVADSGNNRIRMIQA